MARIVPALCAIALTATLHGCHDTVDGVTPVGGTTASQAEVERFGRRLHLDLTGSRADDAYLGTVTAAIADDNSAAARAGLADALLDAPGFASIYVEELENRAFGGEPIDERYEALCGFARVNDAACGACPASADPCSGCDCPRLAALAAERADLGGAASDLADSATTAAIERRYADAAAFYQLADSPQSGAATLFQVFLGRPPGPDELDNAAAMFAGSLLPGAPAGLLFHRHGARYADLVDILFESEIYREAAVRAVFERYLGRPPDAAELDHFTASLDAAAPDVRGVIRAVVSSREYFEQ
jgi:hypothetical protein